MTSGVPVQTGPGRQRLPDLPQNTGNLLPLLIQEIEIVSKNIDHQRSGISRNRLLNPLRQERLDGEVQARKLARTLRISDGENSACFPWVALRLASISLM